MTADQLRARLATLPADASVAQLRAELERLADLYADRDADLAHEWAERCAAEGQLAQLHEALGRYLRDHAVYVHPSGTCDACAALLAAAERTGPRARAAGDALRAARAVAERLMARGVSQRTPDEDALVAAVGAMRRR